MTEQNVSYQTNPPSNPKEEGDALGMVRGPSQQANRFLFITSDNIRTKIGEFVHYYLGNDRENPVYCKIVERTLERSFPSALLADPSVNLTELSYLLGAEEEGNELYQIEAQILGSWHKKMKTFINPRITPNPGDPIFLTPDRLLSEVLSPLKVHDIGSAHLGSLLTRKEGEVPIVLQTKEIVSTHLAILAGTGSGKSYTAGVLVEELLRHYNRAAILIADPHGEYSTLQNIMDNPQFTSGSYRPEVLIKPPEQIHIRLSSLKESDLKYLLPELTEKQSYYLSQAYRKVVSRKEKAGLKRWTLTDLQQALEELAEDNEQNKSTVNALTWKLNKRFGSSRSIFSDSKHIPLTELFYPGRCTVLQLSEIDREDQQIILATILRRALHSRMNAVKGSTQESQENLDYPVFILIEEAHRFAPARGHSISTNVLKTILAEGRKFGLGVGVITQRPGKLDSDVLSQCMTQIFMRIVNPVDQHSIAESVESAGRDLLGELPALTRGQAIVAGNAVNTPVLCKVRQRLTEHGGATLDAPKEWMHFFSSTKEEERQMDKATLPDSRPPKTTNGHIIL